MVEMSEAEFEDAVRDALDAVPPELTALMSNVVVLVDDEPPEPARVRLDPRDLGDEVDIDLAGAGRSRRWRIELELANANLPFRWDGDRLHT